jgi:hypothetical protein
MIVYHVISASKLARCINVGILPPPVRAWKQISSAERFSKQTGRQIILRLKFPDDAQKLPGHRGEAVFINSFYPLSQIFGNKLKVVKQQKR